MEGREDLVILAVATADSLRIENYLETNGLTFKVVKDFNKTLEKIQYKYKAMTIPGNFLIDKLRRIIDDRIEPRAYYH
jgi:hypothetical protein